MRLQEAQGCGEQRRIARPLPQFLRIETRQVEQPTRPPRVAQCPLQLEARAQRVQPDASGVVRPAWAPWTVVPADNKPHRNLMVATVVRDAVRALKLRYPAPVQRG